MSVHRILCTSTHVQADFDQRHVGRRSNVLHVIQKRYCQIKGEPTCRKRSSYVGAAGPVAPF